MNGFLRAALLSLVVTAAACSSGPPRLPNHEVLPSETVAASYRLQPGDVLHISVWKEQDLQAEVLIRPDGGVSFPLAGDVVAAGRTVDEVRADVAERIKHYIPDAAVTVSLKTTTGYKVYVVGKVNRPGEFPLNRTIDVMQAISLAGGTTPFAKVDSIRIVRRTGEQVTTLPFHYSQVARGKHLEQDIQLKSGDTVVVP